MVSNHFTATGIVFNKDKKILMIKHKKLKAWLPPGGHVDENELPDDAVIREIYEETGVTAEIIRNSRLFLTDRHCREMNRPFAIFLEDIERDGSHNHIDLVYLCRAVETDQGELRPQEIEVDGIGWFTPEKIAGMETFENVKKMTAAATERINTDEI